MNADEHRLNELSKNSTKSLAQHSRNQISFMKAGRLLRKRPLAMTRTMRFVIAKRNRPLRPYSVIASEAKQSFSHKQTIPLDKGGEGNCKKLTKKEVFHSNTILHSV